MRQPIDSNEAPWQLEAGHDEPAPPLRGEARADVTIVGGGLTGISTAYHLAERFPERRIAVLEARAVGNGASGRNGGQILNWINGVSDQDPELTRRVHAITRQGIELGASLAAACDVAWAFAQEGCLEVYTDNARAERAQQRVERLTGLGIPLEWIPAARLGFAGACGATADPLAGRLNALALLRAMKRDLLRRGVAIHEHSAVERIEEGRLVRVRTDRGEIRSPTLVLATNGYTPALGYFRWGLLPMQARVLATGRLDPEGIAELGWGGHVGFSDDLDRIAYGCRTEAGRIVFGGGGNSGYGYRLGGRAPAAATAPGERRQFDAVEARLRHYFPQLRDVPIEHRWSGVLGITLDRVCSMGIGGENGNVLHALGYSGHGLALALLAGRVLTDLYAGVHAPWSDLPFYQRRFRPLPPEPLRWAGYQVYTRLTGRSPRRG